MKKTGSGKDLDHFQRNLKMTEDAREREQKPNYKSKETTPTERKKNPKQLGSLVKDKRKGHSYDTARLLKGSKN